MKYGYFLITLLFLMPGNVLPTDQVELPDSLSSFVSLAANEDSSLAGCFTPQEKKVVQGWEKSKTSRFIEVSLLQSAKAPKNFPHLQPHSRIGRHLRALIWHEEEQRLRDQVSGLPAAKDDFAARLSTVFKKLTGSRISLAARIAKVYPSNSPYQVDRTAFIQHAVAHFCAQEEQGGHQGNGVIGLLAVFSGDKADQKVAAEALDMHVGDSDTPKVEPEVAAAVAHHKKDRALIDDFIADWSAQAVSSPERFVEMVKAASELNKKVLASVRPAVRDYVRKRALELQGGTALFAPAQFLKRLHEIDIIAEQLKSDSVLGERTSGSYWVTFKHAMTKNYLAPVKSITTQEQYDMIKQRIDMLKDCKQSEELRENALNVLHSYDYDKLKKKAILPRVNASRAKQSVQAACAQIADTPATVLESAGRDAGPDYGPRNKVLGVGTSIVAGIACAALWQQYRMHLLTQQVACQLKGVMLDTEKYKDALERVRATRRIPMQQATQTARLLAQRDARSVLRNRLLKVGASVGIATLLSAILLEYHAGGVPEDQG